MEMAVDSNVVARPLDLLAVLLYLCVMAGIAVYFSRRNTSTEQYFVGKRSFPGWAVGMSMLATTISSVTFLAFPAAGFAGDYRDLVINFMLPIGVIFAVIVFIPFFRRGKLTSAYEYLGDRYGPVIRVYGTISFMLVRLCWLGVVLCLISNVVVVLTGWPMIPVIVGMGLFVAIYTVMGGMSTVIWTDVIQGIVLMLGGFVAVIYLIKDLPEGTAQVLTVGWENNKFSLGSMAWNLKERTFWTVSILGFLIWMGWHAGDQNMVQRYVAAKSMREARKATIIFGVLAITTWTFFFFVGTCLFVYFKVLPDTELVGLTNDQVFPYFILTRLPAGVAGVVLAGVVAAAMSSVDSTLNAIAAVTVVDLVKPYLAKNRSDRFYLNMARLLAAMTAMIVIVVAINFSRMATTTMNELNWAFGSIFAGCLMALFLLGFFTTRVNYFSALWGLAAAILVNVYLVLSVTESLPKHIAFPVHRYWIGPLVNLAFLVVAYAVGWCSGQRRQNLKGLTVWTLKDSNHDKGSTSTMS